MAKTMIGTVVSNKMQKTAVVTVESKQRHPVYQKVIIRHKKFKVHYDEPMTVAVGDMVEMTETKPYSKEVYFKIVKKLNEQKSK